MQNIMLDLETMSTSANAAIVSIGAVKFNHSEITDKFYTTIDLQSCIKKGFEIDGNTIKWWMKQSDDARKEIYNKGVEIKDALRDFRKWIGKENIQIWGNGADFDNTILTNAFCKYGLILPWPYHSNRCFRTIKYSFETIKIADVGTAHKAVDDAEYQAKYLMALVKRHKLSKLL